MKRYLFILALCFSNYAFSDEIDRNFYRKQTKPTQVKVLVTFPDALLRPIPVERYMDAEAAIEYYTIFQLSGGLTSAFGVSVIEILDTETLAQAQREITKEREIASEAKSSSGKAKRE